MRRFRKRPVEVEAMQIPMDPDGICEVIRWCGAEPWGEVDGYEVESVMKIRTPDGDMFGRIGDWVIREPFPTDDRRFYPCKLEMFEQTYEEVHDGNQEDDDAPAVYVAGDPEAHVEG